MHKKVLRNTLIVIVCLVVLVPFLPQVLLNSPLVPMFVDKWAEEHVDGTLEYADIDFSFLRSFPCVRVTVDSLTVTYPHDRFAAYDDVGAGSLLLSAGRGESVDTLLSMDRLTAAVNPWDLLSGRLRLDDAHLHSLSLYAHVYDREHSNFDVLVFPQDTIAKDSSEVNLDGFPLISVGDVRVARSPRVIYTNQADTVFAVAGFRRMTVAGDVKLGEMFAEARSFDFRIDSLYFLARIPKDSLRLSVEKFQVTADPGEYKVQTNGRMMACTGGLGRIRVPFDIDVAAGLDRLDEGFRVNLEQLNANVAHIPISAFGTADVFRDSAYVDASMSISECDLQTLMDEYVPTYTSSLSTNLLLDIVATAVGPVSRGSLPQIRVDVSLPKGRLRYKPEAIEGTLALEMSATMSENGVLNADVRKFSASSSGVDLHLTGRARNLLDRNPSFGVGVKLSASLTPLMRFVPDELGIKADGNLKFVANGDFTKSQLNSMRFDKGSMSGSLTSDCLTLKIPKDSLDTRLYGVLVSLSADGKGISAEADADTLLCAIGTAFKTKIKRMQNMARIYKAPFLTGRYVTPKLEVTTSEDGIFMRAGESRMGLAGLNMNVSMQRIPDEFHDRRKRYLDSLQMVYPETPRNQLVEIAMRKKFNIPKYVLDKDYHSSDISIPVDTNIRKYLRNWIPTASVQLKRAFVASPAIPLRTRVRDLSVAFDGRCLQLDSVYLSCGTSNLSARGFLRGIVPMVMGRGGLDFDLRVGSGRINANELIAAMAKGQTLQVAESDLDENFGTDTLANARIDTINVVMPLLPANVRANVDLSVDSLTYMAMEMSKVHAGVSMLQRTLQARDVTVCTPLGSAEANMFLSTQSKDDMSVGLSVNLRDMSAQGIVNMIPLVDSLLPVVHTFDGLLNCEVSATTKIDSCLNIQFPTLDGLLRISGHDLILSDVTPLKSILRLLRFKDTRTLRIDDMSVNCVVRNNKVEIFPFILGVDRYKLALRGMQGFDQTMNYHVSVLKSPFLIKFGINAYGTTDNWKIKLCKPLYRDGIPVFTDQLDQMQVNFIDYIRGVYDRLRPSGLMRTNFAESLERRKLELNYSSDIKTEPMPEDESGNDDSMGQNSDIDEFTESLNRDIENSLNAYEEDMDNLLGEYYDQTYDKKILREIERMSRKEKKKKDGKR